ncbi:lateendosome to vacuole transport-family protein [Coprinopsis marcescibilis]|uniref:Lateendosome to vacuole transport-family protein n=1 Tax=Coprinopsis marcescibilis TaxID=230819 RepID=A0A5C3KNA8_COPMA|nr:lateendosome to vacuole transport-family protein [Coprinopsis marcescibilis]
MSRASSVSNLRASTNGRARDESTSRRDPFRWSELQSITNQLFSKASQKATALLGKASFSTPTVLAANGMVCVGMVDGRIAVYDFRQTLKAVCGDESLASTAGPVTSLALSHDHTCIASGHESGHIQLYDLKKPSSPIRSVAPTTLAIIATGRKEGHLQGSRIISMGFVAGRHTALVSADEHGLAFYHSLGKMLFVEASDILRILGQYPDPSKTLPPPGSKGALDDVPGRRQSRYTVLSMAPLPLGTVSHPTDAYDVVALLTPTKLVVVGLRPTPKTWFKRPRELEEGHLTRSKMKGTLAWFPSVSRSSHSSTSSPQANLARQKDDTTVESLSPVLAYSWGNSLHFIKVMESRLKQRVRSSKTGKTADIEIGTIIFEDSHHHVADETIIALQWLHANQLVFVTETTIAVYDTQLSRVLEWSKFDGLSLMSPTLSQTTNGSINYKDSVAEVAHSLRVYKGKMFLLCRDRLLVGTMLTWADHILSLVEAGDFLGAIELCRSYYTDEAPGNRNGLPENLELRKAVIGGKLRSLMQASSNYAFSEDRMQDDTHVTPDNRGVDRTPLFEGLVSASCKASVSLQDFDFLFEDLFQQYDDSGIAGIYLRQMEPFILDNEIRYVPPRITQRLIALHETNGQSEYVERIIWHMDPSCLDLNQTIHLCQKFHLYDALIYIYTRALQDYVAPVVELLDLIRRIRRLRRAQYINVDSSSLDDETSLEALTLNAYKIYPYLSDVLSGLSYPSEEPLPAGERENAKQALYSFLFFGRSSVWPPGNEGKLILTADEEAGMEPTYPYARQLLRFDSEAFLHSLDIAFEDSFLNDDSQTVNRLIIVRILLEILSDDELTTEDATFVNIFIARNVPKYPQFLPISPTILHNVLIGLGEDPDPSTREDRQLAAEYLLSVYNPHDSERIVSLFEEAGFYRILRTWYRHDRRWTPLFFTYINDQQLHPSSLFASLHEVLNTASRQTKGSSPDDLANALADSLSPLLHASFTNTAALVDHHHPRLHEQALRVLKTEFEGADEAQFLYLKHLFIGSNDDEDVIVLTRKTTPADLPQSMLKSFIELQTRLHPEDAVDVLKCLDDAITDWTEIMEICESNNAWNTVVWAMDWKGEPQAALKKSGQFYKQLVRSVIRSLSNQERPSKELNLFVSLGYTGREICLQRSQSLAASEVPLEDLWFALLSTQIHAVQTVSASGLDESGEDFQSVLIQLRSLVQTTFTGLVSITSTQAVSFPRLFKRLVDSTPTASGTHYTEFRIILGGMLESYRSDADMLDITKQMIGRDLFENFARVSTAKKRGWAASRGVCSICKRPLLGDFSPKMNHSIQVSVGQIVVSRTGLVSHQECLLSRTLDES